MTRLLAITAGLLLASTAAARADPIFTPLVLGALSYFGITGVAATIIAAVTVAVIVAGIGIGLSLLFSPKPAKPQDGSVPIQQNVPFRIYGYGTDRIGGAIMFKEESGGTLGMVLALNGHQISAFRQLYLNDDPVTVPPSGARLAGAVQGGSDGRYADGVIQVDTRLGATPEVNYSLISSAFPGAWATNARGDGVASIALTCASTKSDKFQQTYPYGAPTPSVVLDQTTVFDPRDGQWKFSDNAVLALLHFRCFSPYGSQLDYGTAIAPNLQRWLDAITVCDEATPLGDGTNEARYRIAGWITTEQDRKTTETSVRSCGDIWTVDRGDGSIDVEAGRYYTPTVVLTDDDIKGWTVQRGSASKDRVNRVTARYKSPAANYSIAETWPVDDLADQTLRPGPPRAVEMDLTWVPSSGQASRLVMREFFRQTQVTRGTLICGLSGLNAAYARRVLIQSNSIPRLGNVVVEVSKPVISLMQGTVTFDFVASGPGIDAYDPTLNQTPAPPPPSPPDVVLLPVPANVAVSAQQSGSTVTLAVSWDTPSGYSVSALDFRIQWRTHDTGGGMPGAWTQQTFTDPTVASGRVSAVTGAVPTGTTLDVQVFSIGPSGALSAGSAVVTVDTSLSTVAPAVPIGLSAMGGTGTATVQCTNPNSPTFAAVRFYRAAHGSPFSSATLIATVYGSPNGTSTFSNTGLAPGSYDFFATAISSSGNASASVGPAAATAI